MKTAFAVTAILASMVGVPAQPTQTSGWKPLFDGASLKGWRETPFSGHGKVRVEDGTIILGNGWLTGITWTEPFPKANYEVRLEAARVNGDDFFAGITFPVHDSFLSWINGGWGGMVVGISSLDSMDASENDTSIMRSFERGHWYALRLRVTDDRIHCGSDSELALQRGVGAFDRRGLRNACRRWRMGCSRLFKNGQFGEYYVAP